MQKQKKSESKGIRPNQRLGQPCELAVRVSNTIRRAALRISRTCNTIRRAALRISRTCNTIRMAALRISPTFFVWP